MTGRKRTDGDDETGKSRLTPLLRIRIVLEEGGNVEERPEQMRSGEVASD